MPQIWLTYEELAEFTGCSVEESKRGLSEEGWSRRKCSDGLTRVKLPNYSMERYLLEAALGRSSSLSGNVEQLRAVLATMQKIEPPHSQTARAA